MRYENDDRPRCWLHTDWVAADQVWYDDKLVWACDTCLEFITQQRSTGYECQHCHVPVRSETDFTPIHKVHLFDCPRVHDWVNLELYRAYG